MIKHRKLLGVTLIVAGLFCGSLALAGAAGAHVAPPVGKSTCSTTNTTTWMVSGSATVSQAGSDKVKDNLTTTAGTIVQTPLATALESDGQVYTYIVTGIPDATHSVTITSTLTWDRTGKYVDSVTINIPDNDCVVKTSSPPPSSSSVPPSSSTPPPSTSTPPPSSSTTTPALVAKVTPQLPNTGLPFNPLYLVALALILFALGIPLAIKRRKAPHQH